MVTTEKEEIIGIIESTCMCEHPRIWCIDCWEKAGHKIADIPEPEGDGTVDLEWFGSLSEREQEIVEIERELEPHFITRQRAERGIYRGYDCLPDSHICCENCGKVLFIYI